jgi:two-component system, chemotaxis family, protein-glutamate methylesterase/glutaminase
MSRFAIITLGGSAGSIGPMREVLAQLPKDIHAAIFVVLHIGARPSQLPSIIQLRSALPVMHAEDKLMIAPGRVYVAPPDHHLVLANGAMELSRGPRENWTRPAIDPLFRSAATAFKDRVVGVVLSGNLNDGTAGLIHIKEQGGITIVQDPGEATVPDMPWNALRDDHVDYTATVEQLPPLLQELADSIARGGPRPKNMRRAKA